MIQLIWAIGCATPQFGGEDLVTGDPWYHQLLSEQAARAADWSPAAAGDLAWHAKRIDDYLYNPLWWPRIGLSGWRAARTARHLLVRLHFDDLSTTEQVHQMWRRYTSGTLAGLLFAWQRGDVAAARHTLGVGLHAVQDFYSHSNWVDDPVRRVTSWSEASPAVRSDLPLYTGGYEHPGRPIHGKLGFGPRRRPGAIDLRPRRFARLPVAPRLVSAAPPGMALDSRWQADVAAQVRGVTDVTGAELFESAVDLAHRDSTAWLAHHERLLIQAGAADFCRAMKTARVSPAARRPQFEGSSGFPFAFSAVGQYPPTTDPEGSWYLRLDLGAGPAASVRWLGPFQDLPQAARLRAPTEWGPRDVSGFAFTRDDEVRAVWLRGAAGSRRVAPHQWADVRLDVEAEVVVHTGW